MTPESNNRVYWHRWFPSSENGMPVERCRCGVMRNLDGSNDRCLCSAAKVDEAATFLDQMAERLADVPGTWRSVGLHIDFRQDATDCRKMAERLRK